MVKVVVGLVSYTPYIYIYAEIIPLPRSGKKLQINGSKLRIIKNLSAQHVAVLLVQSHCSLTEQRVFAMGGELWEVPRPDVGLGAGIKKLIGIDTAVHWQQPFLPNKVNLFFVRVGQKVLIGMQFNTKVSCVSMLFELVGYQHAEHEPLTNRHHSNHSTKSGKHAFWDASVDAIGGHRCKWHVAQDIPGNRVAPRLVIGTASAMATSLSVVMWSDPNLSDSDAEFIKESARVVLETMAASSIDSYSWQELALNSAKASVGRLANKSPTALGDMSLESVVPTFGTTTIEQVAMHKFAGIMKNELPRLKHLIKQVMARAEYGKFKFLCESILEDAEQIGLAVV